MCAYVFFNSAKADCPKLSCENVLVSCLVTVLAPATLTSCIHLMINSKTQKWLGPSSEPMFFSTFCSSLLGSCCFLITGLRLQRAKEHLHVWRFNTAKGEWKASHAVQNSCRPDQQSFMQWFSYYFPNAWYVENELLPFSYKRAITFTSFHPSNLIDSFCKLTNKHRVFPMEDYTWIQNCRNAGLWLGVGCSLWDTCTDGPFSHYDLCRRCLYSHSQGVPREFFRWRVEASRVVELMGG